MALFDVREFEREDCGGYDGHPAEIFHPTDRCFVCYDPLGDDTLIHWTGYTDADIHEIWMHVKCARYLALALLKDVKRTGQTGGLALVSLDSDRSKPRIEVVQDQCRDFLDSLAPEHRRLVAEFFRENDHKP
jgi:hypothetical protein